MDYFITFLEGIITFISPCLLPMLPVYVSYFAGQNHEEAPLKPLVNAIGFVLGFTIVFVTMGAFAGTAGRFLKEYQTTVNIVTGLIVVFFGLSFVGVFNLPFMNISKRIQIKHPRLRFFSSLLFGLVFSIGWTPCVGIFLGSALMLAAQSGESLKGLFMLLSFSMGLGIPFVASALLIDRLKGTFHFIKKHYGIIQLISGGLLIVLGLMMATGLMGRFLSFLSI